jgi:RNA polymerase sigma factor (sigma-70 family)
MTPEQRRQINEYMARLAHDGHPESWRELYILLRPFAVRMAAQRIKDPHALEDVVQSSFLRLHKVSHRFHERADAVSFYEHILVNVIRENHTRHRRDGAVLLLPDLSGIAEEFPTGQRSGTLTDPEYATYRSHLWERFDKAMENLPPTMQEAVLDRLVEGMTSSQAAGKAKCSSVAIRKRLERALVKLRARLRGFRGLPL